MLWITAVVVVAGYVAAVVGLVVVGRRQHARAVAGVVPDCLVLFKRLAQDPALGRRSRIVVVLLIAYLALPIDLVPDFIPVAGQADDLIVVGLALRYLLRSVPVAEIEARWPGPPQSLGVLLRLAGRQRTM